VAIVVAELPPSAVGQPRGTINLMYFGTPPGIIKVVQFVVGVVLLFLSKPIFMSIIVYLAFILSNIWLWVYVFSCQKRWIVNPPWIVLEFFYTGGATFFYGLATLLAFIFTYWVPAAFGILNTIAYAAGTFFLFHEWREYKQNQNNPDVPKV